MIATRIGKPARAAAFSSPPSWTCCCDRQAGVGAGEQGLVDEHIAAGVAVGARARRERSPQASATASSDASVSSWHDIRACSHAWRPSIPSALRTSRIATITATHARRERDQRGEQAQAHLLVGHDATCSVYGAVTMRPAELHLQEQPPGAGLRQQHADRELPGRGRRPVTRLAPTPGRACRSSARSARRCGCGSSRASPGGRRSRARARRTTERRSTLRPCGSVTSTWTNCGLDRVQRRVALHVEVVAVDDQVGLNGGSGCGW